MKNISLIMIATSFLGGAFLTSLDATQVNWSWFMPVLAFGGVGLFLFKKENHKEGKASHKLEQEIDTLASSLSNIVTQLTKLNTNKADLPTYEARFEIDRLFRDDLTNFAEARESMRHVFGLQNYADIMSAFAAGERYINRVWSASTDGYVDEVNEYLNKADIQFQEALEKFNLQYQAD